MAKIEVFHNKETGRTHLRICDKWANTQCCQYTGITDRGLGKVWCPHAVKLLRQASRLLASVGEGNQCQ